ncbi:acyltransferase family protein [Streptomyces sp. ATCC 21386]|uniref:acyltransferase family protein n=1 Tax=Streptomyces sp. ATCC 21386 TaxID=2699428 RepID=UPI0027E4F025|nr:acyltransferase family protein [Streptomyces sp. ATCC 21386]
MGGAGDPRRDVPRYGGVPGDTGQSSWTWAGCAAALVVACAVGSAYVDGDGGHFTRRAWIVSFLLAVVTFGIGLALRRRRIPRLLTFLGTISYSVYLVHPLLLAVSDGTIGRRPHDDLALEVAFYAMLLPVCVLTYYCVEAPAQKWGRRFTRRQVRERPVSGVTSERVDSAASG